jgi:hypothetical protein
MRVHAGPMQVDGYKKPRCAYFLPSPLRKRHFPPKGNTTLKKLSKMRTYGEWIKNTNIFSDIVLDCGLGLSALIRCYAFFRTTNCPLCREHLGFILYSSWKPSYGLECGEAMSSFQANFHCFLAAVQWTWLSDFGTSSSLTRLSRNLDENGNRFQGLGIFLTKSGPTKEGASGSWGGEPIKSCRLTATVCPPSNPQTV